MSDKQSQTLGVDLFGSDRWSADFKHRLAALIVALEKTPERQLGDTQLYLFLLRFLQRGCELRERLHGEDLMVSALATRQLLETLIVSEYTCRSKDKGEHFVRSYHKDALDVEEAYAIWLATLAERVDEPLDLSEKYRQIAGRKEDIRRRKYPLEIFDIARAAKAVSLDRDYRALHKLCSKLLHCTPLVVLDHRHFFQRNDDLARNLRNTAALYAYRAYKVLFETIQKERPDLVRDENSKKP
jgi:hypothetical protein